MMSAIAFFDVALKATPRKGVIAYDCAIGLTSWRGEAMPPGSPPVRYSQICSHHASMETSTMRLWPYLSADSFYFGLLCNANPLMNLSGPRASVRYVGHPSGVDMDVKAGSPCS
jgi:hypothetical protein